MAATRFPPRDDYERAVCELFKQLFGLADCGIHDDFFALGGRSLMAVRLFEGLRRQYGVELGLAVLFEASTVAQLAGLLRDRQARDEDVSPGNGVPPPSPPSSQSDYAPLVPIRAHGSRPTLFLMPGQGGNVVGFEALARHLGDDQPVSVLQSMGLDGRRPPFTRMDVIASHFISEIRAVQPRGPYLLGGFSFGGVVAFEMAQQLHRAGERVALLAIIDTLLDRMYLSDPGGWTRAKNAATFWQRRVRLHVGTLLRDSVGGRTEYAGKLRHRLQKRRRSRAWQRTNQIQHVADRLRGGDQLALPEAFKIVKEANAAAMAGYDYRPYGGSASLYEAAIKGISPCDSTANWRYLVPNGLCVHTVPGQHTTILDEPHVRDLAAAINTDIARALPLAAATA